MDANSGVKTASEAKNAVAVLKFNVAEEIATENYNYRLQTTVFLSRPAFDPFKRVMSSQEWCGTSFKQLRWRDQNLVIRSFSYLSGQGDRTFQLSGDVVPFDALPVIVRDVAAAGVDRTLNLLVSMRSTREVEPNAKYANLRVGKIDRVTVPLGRFQARRVTIDWNGPKAAFDVETDPPYRLLQYTMGDLSGELLYVERRAYWDRNWESSFHPTGRAP